MDRLTFEIDGEGIFVKKSDVETWLVKYGIIHTGDAVRKLAQYENLEEQGRLLKLPCAVGDTVWYWDEDRYSIEDAPVEGYVSEYKIGSKNSILIIITPKRDFASDCFYSNRDTLFIEDFGKTIFYTKEEAEAALNDYKIGDNK